jgi:hypothetical protein
MAPEVAYKPDAEAKGGAENRIPKERVDAMIAKAKADAEAKAAAAEERARLESERRKDLEARIQSTAPPAASPEKAPPTRAQLRQLVDEGQITQEQMDEEIERQIEARVSKKVSEVQDTKSRAAQINEQIDRYSEKIPDIADPTSDNHKRLRSEFAALRKLGYANDATTELLALRATFGDVSKVNIPESGNKDREVDTSTHTGSGGEGEAEEVEPGKGPIKGLPKQYVDHYQKGIEAGRYSGWDDERLIRVQKRALARGRA